jgi:hypothetical protein
MTLKAFTDNYADNSTEAGFQFTFNCNICNEGYKSTFVASTTYKKGKFLSGFGKVAGAATQMAGTYKTGVAVSTGANVLGERFHGMSPQWQKEHETAFFAAQDEVKGSFVRCPKCTRWVCHNDWNEQAGLCMTDGPRAAVEVATARSQKMVQDIHQKAQQTTVFTGEIEDKQTTCPQCGRPAGTAKFCANCGAPLGMAKCPKCGAQAQAGTKFCPECGTKFG